jgi:single-strand DNA-binding protein
MASLNKVFLIGNLTRDPELRQTPKGTPIANIGVAVNRTWSTDAGEQREETTFVDVEVWGRQAETANQYLSKGRPVFIEGRLKLDSWEDKQSGQKRNRLKVVAERVQFLGLPRRGEYGDAPDTDRGAGGRGRPEPVEGEPREAPAGGGEPREAPAGGGAPADDENLPF